MLNKHYLEMLHHKSVIRELSEYAARRGREIGYENVFDYSLGNPSVPVPQRFTDEAVRLLREEEPVRLHGYSPSLGIDSVKERIAASLNRRFGMEYGANHIFPAAGAAGAIAHALRAVTTPGEEVLVFAPFFPEYVPYINETGARIRIVPAQEPDFQPNLAALEEMLTPSSGAVLLNTPNNPTGVVYTEETLRALAQLLAEKSRAFGHTIFLISDEPYREICFDGKKAPYPAGFYDNTVTCYSFSKSLSVPGERIGYVAVHPACEGAAQIVPMCGQISRGIGHNCPASLIQLSAAASLEETADLSVYEVNRNLLYEALTRLGFAVEKPGGTFYIFPRALEKDSVAFCKKALAYDLILVPADGFGAPGYFRMAYCIATDKVRRSIPALERFVREVYGQHI